MSVVERAAISKGYSHIAAPSTGDGRGRPLSDLMEERARLIAAKRSCRRLGLWREALECERDLIPVELAIYERNAR